MHFQYEDGNPGRVLAREFVNRLVKHTFPLSLGLPPSLPTKCAYPTEKIPINQKKLEDIAKLKNYVPGYAFYDEIFTWPSTNVD
ncbi:hypothetical protein ANN_09788 [Periplaneta americana]|uniref:Per a allergen n=1 Tax=Periplaneta americana TaxID=6978 RepID=A0ABQ8TQX3_PERAM|nr:hypothetical protein ANN_09788 [Periplaneta americana]